MTFGRGWRRASAASPARRWPRRGLLSAALLAVMSLPPALGAPANAAGGKLVTIIATEYRFEPNQLVLRRGVRYRLRIVNRGRELHELTAPAFFKAAQLGNPEVLNRERTEIAIPPGETRDLYFVVRSAGRFDMRCADHDWAGMTGEIEVE